MKSEYSKQEFIMAEDYIVKMGQIEKLCIGKSPKRYRLNEGCSESLIIDWEREHGISLPADYRKILMLHNGFQLSTDRGLFPLEKLYAIKAENGKSIYRIGSLYSLSRWGNIYMDIDGTIFVKVAGGGTKEMNMDDILRNYIFDLTSGSESNLNAFLTGIIIFGIAVFLVFVFWMIFR